jgi:hypothetical protein
VKRLEIQNNGKVKPPKFDGSTFWAVFHLQFKAVASHDNWTHTDRRPCICSLSFKDKLLTLDSVQARVTYEDTVGVL